MNLISKIPIKKIHLLETYRWLVIMCGIPFFGLALSDLSNDSLNVNLLLLIAFTSIFASRISIKFPSFNGTITVSDSLTFIALLLWGPAAAIVTSVAESIALTYRLKSKLLRTYLFNIASSALITWIGANALFYTFGPANTISRDLPAFKFMLAMCLLALSYFVASMVITAIIQMLKLELSQWKEWSRYYLWTCITFFVGVAIAGVFVKLIFLGGLIAALLIAPIAIISYLAYTSYIRTVDALQASESRFRSSFDYATIGMGIVSPTGNWLQVNNSLREMLRCSEQDLISSNFRTVLHPESIIEVQENVDRIFSGELPAFQIETRFLSKDETDVWATLGVSTAHDSQGEIRHLIFQIQDITSRKKAEEKLWFDANHDVLTGLPNRAAFVSRLEEIVSHEMEFEHPLFAVLFLDLDGFKIVNDSLGHAAGDELLRGVSQRLLECIRGNDVVARLGGDEFTVLLVNLQSIDQAVIVAERIKGKMTKAFQIADQEVFIGTSIGIATSDIGYENADEMLRDADAAMYQAKASGKGCFSLFDNQMYSNALRLLHLANDLRRGVERDEFIVHYQPIKSLETNKVRALEALVRWNHPTLGTLAPMEFIPLAEENGIINEIDNWVMLQACRQMKQWQNEFEELKDIAISVNISSRQFAQSGLFDTVKNVLMETGLAPSNLLLEITESAMIKNLKNTAKILRELNFLGVRIALDDFGTGYSSLNYLHELPISVLKIDRSFVRRIDNEQEGIEIVKAIVALASSLRMETTAEGIETEHQFSELRAMGCISGQGFYLSRPLDAAAATEYLISDGVQVVAIPERSRGGLRLVNM
ncbi:MAG: EAL domain-containing protein [Acidobacteria bacterium]|nr:EAL domain-containing protein [Acidobacteriota bacterium]MBK8147350.1 EAL domain-containing protein [Acidobacteriota bacterium]MBK8810528.1 EAL domain-containing protein [Acidobacteriota bacterium]